MTATRACNIIGALSLAVADDIVRATAEKVPDGGPTAAVIVLIAHEPGISIRMLSAGVALSHAGTVRLVDREALVERRPSSGDRRERAFHLTDRDTAMCDGMLRAREGVAERGLAVLSDSELATLAERQGVR